MATGTGKTKLAIALLYRLLATKRFRRICFVVDRSALGDQAAGEFSTTKIVSGKAFADIFGLKRLHDVTPETDTKVHICTIQGLVRRVLYAADNADTPPIDQYDLMVVDECHRGYLLDREMSDAELSFRGQEDYISKYRRVLEYFDAVKVGLTATPALHTTDIFGDPIFTYSYRQAVIDGYLIDHEPPVRIETALARAGIIFKKGEQLDLLNTSTGEIDLVHAPDEIRFEVDQFNKQVVTPEFNRVVAEELANHIDPHAPGAGKTLIFTATDAHADIVVSAIKKAFAAKYGDIDDADVKKITGSVDNVRTLIRSFRNDASPKIAVTVDLLTTGVDLPSITNLVFLRRVNSRILYEQMIGRATRPCPEIGKEVFRIFDAVDLYPHLQNLTDMKPVVVNPSISFERLIKELIAAGHDAHRETIRDQLAVKLRRRLKQLPMEARSRYEEAVGEPPEATLKRLLEAKPAELSKWFSSRPTLGPILDWQSEGETPRLIPISTHLDELVAVTRGYGEATKPADFLEAFAAYVRDNINTIAALKVVVQRPRDLTRAGLREVRAANRRFMARWKQQREETYKFAVQAFFEPTDFLRTLQHWILFYVEDGETRKSILRQHQRIAIDKIVERCEDASKKRGLVWHTQGSGKTFTLLTAARLILEEKERFKNATVILVVDRTELEGQLKGWVEKLLGEMQQQDIPVWRANSKTDVQELLMTDKRGLIISMIHKFEGIDKDANTRDNIYVFIDEAHRSVAKDLGTYMMAAVPHATIIGFTGTPIAKTAQGEGTFKIFGTDDEQGYLDKYSIRESIEDETTLPIRHTMAPSEMRVPTEQLDKEFFELAAAEGVTDIDELPSSVLHREASRSPASKAVATSRRGRSFE
jgi:type I site-specific restriction endonuclease